MTTNNATPETYYVSTTHGTVWSGKKSQMREDYCYGFLTYFASEKEAKYSVRIRREASYGRVSRENELAWVASLMAGRAVNVEGTIVNP